MAPCAMVDEQLPISIPSTHAKLSPSRINASVLHGPKDLRVETRTLALPLDDELQIIIKSTGKLTFYYKHKLHNLEPLVTTDIGICGSDVSYYKKFANGDLYACAPLSLGHESSGIVAAIGPNVTNFQIGDRVALEVGIPCGECGICRKGRYNLCKKMRFRSSAKSVPHFQGTLQERINHPAKWCHRIPDHVSFDAAALLEPLSVAIHAVNRANPAPGSTALVIGAGTVGLLTAAMARKSGCTEVTIVDVDAGRVNYAITKGFASHGYVVPKPLHTSPSSSSISMSTRSGTSSPSGIMTPMSGYNPLTDRFDAARSLSADILAISTSCHSEDEDEDAGVDTTFECTGKEICMQTALYATRPGGKVIMVGMGTPIQTLPLSAAHLREVDILGIFRYANTYATGIRLLSAGCLPSLDDMVTHRFKGLDSAKKAFQLAGETIDDEGRLVLKVVIEA